MAIDLGGVYHPNFKFWQRNPIILYILAQTLLGLAASFGLQLDGKQTFAIMGTVNVVLMLLYGMQVVPLPNATGAVNQALFTPIPQTPEEADNVRPAVKPAVGAAK